MGKAEKTEGEKAEKTNRFCFLSAATATCNN
jgi:hypothetical protein